MVKRVVQRPAGQGGSVGREPWAAGEKGCGGGGARWAGGDSKIWGQKFWGGAAGRASATAPTPTAASQNFFPARAFPSSVPPPTPVWMGL